MAAPKKTALKHSVHADLRPSRDEAERAIEVLLRWAGDDPGREGLRDTPSRVAKAFEEWFQGYKEDPEEYLKRTFEEVEGYDEMIVLRDIRFESHCEHHLAPIIGKAHVAYLPEGRVVGISKLARVLDAYAKRMQVQEKMTAQIATTLMEVLQPRGVAVVIEAQHMCMMMRGVQKQNSLTTTSAFTGEFQRVETRSEFLTLIGHKLH
ncbi:MAG TPA: GTP cyclohydrolase I FolE [Alphaproteobacteria bacterium]|nr:GTP cyclohydrolase I FolE [Alphaproteobacteria bacterium]